MLTAYTDSQTPLNQKVQYPWGVMDTLLIAFAASMTQAINNGTILTLGQLTANATLNVTPAVGLPIGTRLFIKVPTAGTQTLTLGTGFQAPSFNGVAGKTKTQEFAFDGTNFIPASDPIQID